MLQAGGHGGVSQRGKSTRPYGGGGEEGGIRLEDLQLTCGQEDTLFTTT